MHRRTKESERSKCHNRAEDLAEEWWVINESARPFASPADPEFFGRYEHCRDNAAADEQKLIMIAAPLNNFLPFRMRPSRCFGGPASDLL